ncbi:hypothetical protein [Moorena sp. SIO3I6]|uniref:hypothetical protein n=1 Tax=Moorena sp. SIO3I6 TaxID=2607831 RepID=UPI002600065C|nr:hypothetical protein [Moorena sp. SIO3I6]
MYKKKCPSVRTQTQAGSDFVARMLTVVTTLKSQKRDVLEFLVQAVVAARSGSQARSLLPLISTSCME